MLSPEEIAKIKAEIENLESDFDSCTDTAIRNMIEVRIKEQKQKLASEHSIRQQH